jgi:hypothetical protein
MIKFLVLAATCLSLCACGGSNSSSSTSQTTTPKISDFQGIYVGSTEYSGGRNSGGTIQVTLNLDTTGISTGSSPITTEAQILSAMRLNSKGEPIGTTSFLTNTGAAITVSYSGSIDLSREGAFDISFTYSGAISGSFRAFGNRPQIAVHVSASASTINLGDVVYLYNTSLMPGSTYPLTDGGSLDNLNQYFSWSIKSAPFGSGATIGDGNAKYGYDKSFSPDIKGTYIITLTGRNGTGTPSSADVVIIVI